MAAPGASAGCDRACSPSSAALLRGSRAGSDTTGARCPSTPRLRPAKSQPAASRISRTGNTIANAGRRSVPRPGSGGAGVTSEVVGTVGLREGIAGSGDEMVPCGRIADSATTPPTRTATASAASTTMRHGTVGLGTASGLGAGRRAARRKRTAANTLSSAASTATVYTTTRAVEEPTTGWRVEGEGVWPRNATMVTASATSWTAVNASDLAAERIAITSPCTRLGVPRTSSHRIRTVRVCCRRSSVEFWEPRLRSSQSPASAAILARCSRGCPNSWALPWARLKYSCASCSQVMPIPPCN